MSVGGGMPAGRRPHEPAELTLRVRRTETGHLAFSLPGMCPGWEFVARQPAQIGEAIARAYTEAQLAAYARWRGALYDLAETEDEIPPEAYARGSRHPGEPDPPPVDEVTQRRRKKHPGTHEPTEWTLLDDGGALSPAGRRYAPDTPHAQRAQQAHRVLVARGRL